MHALWTGTRDLGTELQGLVKDNEQIRGMLHRVRHLVKVDG